MEMPSISRSISAPATSASGVGAEICNTDPVRAYNDLVSRLQVCPLVQIRTFTDSFLSLASLGTATTRCVMGGVLRDQGLGLGLDHRHTTCLSFFASLTRTAADRWRGAR